MEEGRSYCVVEKKNPDNEPYLEGVKNKDKMKKDEEE